MLFYEKYSKKAKKPFFDLQILFVMCASDCYCVLMEPIWSFFDKGKLVILINGFQKKTQKTPKKEIEIAEKLKSQYFEALENIKE